MAVQEGDVGRAGIGCVATGEVDHLVGHVQPVGVTGRPDALGRQQDVDAAAGAEIEDRFARSEVRNSDRVAATEAGQPSTFRQAFEIVVERGAETRVGWTVRGLLSSRGHGCGSGIPAANLRAQGVGFSGHRVLLDVVDRLVVPWGVGR